MRAPAAGSGPKVIVPKMTLGFPVEVRRGILAVLAVLNVRLESPKELMMVFGRTRERSIGNMEKWENGESNGHTTCLFRWKCPTTDP